MTPSLLSTIYGLASAASWGTGDFAGGVASKTNSTFAVVVLSQIVGGVLMFILALAFGESFPSTVDVLWGAASGLAGVVGLLALYHGLSQGRMGIFAPLTAVVGATFPVPLAFLQDGLPPVTTLIGLGLSLVAVWLLSAENGIGNVKIKDLGLPFISGMGFGLFFILIAQVDEGSVFWPLTFARIASVSVVALIIIGRGRKIGKITQLPVILISGICDAGGNAFFTLASQAGRLDVAALLSSLYPAATVLLAWIILKERLQFWQWVGVAFAFAALILIAL